MVRLTRQRAASSSAKPTAASATDAAPQTEGEAADAPPQATPAQAPAGAPAVTGLPADGVREFKRVLASATVRRWPMYLRNVQQIVRDASFDVRNYGFGTLVDLLRAAHRDGVVRVDRDRQGVIRVFAGNLAPAGAPEPVVVPFAPIDDTGVEAEAPAAPIAATPAVDAAAEPEDDPDDNIGNVADGAPAPAHKPGRRRPAAAGASRTPRRRRTRSAK